MFNKKSKLRIFEIISISIGLFILTFLLYLEVIPRIYQSLSIKKWEVKSTSQNVIGQKLLKKEIKNNQLGLIIIKKLDLRLSVLEGATTNNLNLAPSHIKDTAYPGTIGNAVISGHRVTHGFPFRNIDDLKKGDIVTFQNSTGSFSYTVTHKKRVDPNDTSVLNQTKIPRLTLLTCDPPFSAKYRLAVISETKNYIK